MYNDDAAQDDVCARGPPNDDCCGSARRAGSSRSVYTPLYIAADYIVKERKEGGCPCRTRARAGRFLHMCVLFVLYVLSVPTYLPVLPIVTINSKSKVFLKDRYVGRNTHGNVQKAQNTYM